MTRDRQGWTIVELLVSIAVLALLLALVTQALAMTQRSWLSTRASAEMLRTVEDAQGMLNRHISLATLQPRPRFDSTTGTLMPESDLHFVCGAATDLLPSVPGACGDAIFFQHPANEGLLQNALHACGFVVQYGDDKAWMPAFLPAAVLPRKRFRLMQFHQSADALTLFHQPPLASFTTRAELYAWFASAMNQSNLSVVAENVLGMIIHPTPGTPRDHDTRRHQWEGKTTASDAARHHLPQTIEVNFLITDEASWSKLSPTEAETLASALIKMTGDQIKNGESPQTILTVLEDEMETHGLRTRVVKTVILL